VNLGRVSRGINRWSRNFLFVAGPYDQIRLSPGKIEDYLEPRASGYILQGEFLRYQRNWRA
jgi:hypothetical protein